MNYSGACYSARFGEGKVKFKQSPGLQSLWYPLIDNGYVFTKGKRFLIHTIPLQTGRFNCPKGLLVQF